MKAFIRNTKTAGNALALLFALAFAICANAQTDYKEVPLNGTPIKVTERKVSGDQGSLQAFDQGQSTPGSVNSTTGSVSGIRGTKTSFSVSDRGSSVCHVPIAVPPGINGVVPQIALVHDSQNGNGIPGYGWSISGISTITRVAATKYHDGFIDPVDFDDNDRFALDGVRLMLKSGTYGGNGAVYETERFSNTKITSYGSGNGTERFKVEYPDGSFAWYGTTSSDRSLMEYAISYLGKSPGYTDRVHL
ncbi:SpvB/TcaC N-terminal domain-containing protein [Maribacter sp. 2-571]|uniref:SpvB/TcaC N-terminal domain-containing protein n=1 Tax=Maribacter sp. 2-571 TaxID=3417569 RepID=UPI003D359781